MPEFSSSDKDVLERQIDLSFTPQDSDLDLDLVFEIEKCCSWICERGLRRVALQFPDSLLSLAPAVAARIHGRITDEVFVLGDTSYGECCVDEVAAQHLNADAVIHFGHTCLTPSQNLPVLYVFTRRDLNLELFLNILSDKFTVHDKLLLLYDVEYDHVLSNLEVPGLHLVVGVPSEETEILSAGWIRKFGRKFNIEGWELLKDYKVVYISTGDGGDLKLMNFNFSFAGNDFYVYCNGELVPGNSSINKLLMKRYFLIEKAKDAERIGILVGTLGTSSFNTIINQLRATIMKCGKRCYTFLVGKPNAAKLANFPEIDIFVLVSCPETAFPDTSEYYQNVITPYELEIACNSNRVWGGDYITDYRDLLYGTPGFIESPEVPGHLPDVSLVSGRMRGGTGRVDGEGGELVVVNDRTIGLLHSGGGGEFLANRTWSGLEQKLGQTEVGGIVQGKDGIAAGYSDEPVLEKK